MSRMFRIYLFALLATILLPFSAYAQDNSGVGANVDTSGDSSSAYVQDQITTVKAQVVKIDSQGEETVPGTETQTEDQTIDVKILEGTSTGSIVTFDNDYVILKVGDLFYLTKTVSAETGQTYYAVGDPYRLNSLIFFIALFVLLVVIFGGRQGIRGLISLCGSLILILYVFLPGVLHGYSPVLMSIGVASLIIIIGSYITHGFNKSTTAAVIGMIVTVLVTGVLAYWAIHMTHLTGYENEEASYLNLYTNGKLDFVGLLLGGMLIGILGVLYDAAIGQSIAVEELHAIAPHISRWKIYRRAIRMGREHIGALVNTLAIAYVGVSLPILLLFSISNSPFSQLINRENFATEIIRTMIGSIGLVLAVPITTLLACFILIRKRPAGTDESKGIVDVTKEEHELEHYQHHH